MICSRASKSQRAVSRWRPGHAPKQAPAVGYLQQLLGASTERKKDSSPATNPGTSVLKTPQGRQEWGSTRGPSQWWVKEAASSTWLWLNGVYCQNYQILVVLVVGFYIQWEMGMTTSYVNEPSDSRGCNKYLLGECCWVDRALGIHIFIIKNTNLLLWVNSFHKEWDIPPGLEVGDSQSALPGGGSWPCPCHPTILYLLPSHSFSSCPFSSLREEVVSESGLKFISPGKWGEGTATISSLLILSVLSAPIPTISCLLQHFNVHLLRYIFLFFHVYLLSSNCFIIINVGVVD